MIRTGFKRQIILGLGFLLLASFAAAQAGKPDKKEIIERARREIAAHGWQFQVGDNPALDTPLQQITGLREPGDWRESAYFDDLPVTRALPSSWDWRANGGVTPVKNQSACGSCWAFSTVGGLECAIQRLEGVTVDLSEQYLVSCDTSNDGCTGGWFAHDFHISPGSVYETCFPYTATEEACHDDCPHPYFLDSWAYIGNSYSIPATDQIKQAIYDHGPVCAAMAASESFQAYTGGVYEANDSSSLNHAIMLVGWDDNALGTGKGCWILRNSWGAGWGIGGYAYITYGCNQTGYAANYVTYVPNPNPSITIQSTSADPSGNGRLDPGETAQVFVTLANFGAGATGVSATLSTADAHCTVTAAGSAYPDLPRAGTGQNATAFQVAIAPDVPAGHAIPFNLAVTADGGYATSLPFSLAANLPPVLVLDLDSNQSSGPAVQAAVEANGVAALYATTYDLNQLSPFQAVFVCLGVYSSNHVLTAAEGTALAAYLDLGGHLYMEGGDTWFYDDPTAVHDYFHITGDEDGGGDLATIRGLAGTPWEGLSLAYGGANSFIDRLSPGAGAVKILENSSPVYGTGVSYAGAGYRTIGVSFEFAGLTDGAGDNTKAAVMGRILDFFEFLDKGDLNGDGAVDAADAEILRNYLAGTTGSIPAGADAADCNSDGSVDATDLAILLNRALGH